MKILKITNSLRNILISGTYKNKILMLKTFLQNKLLDFNKYFYQQHLFKLVLQIGYFKLSLKIHL